MTDETEYRPPATERWTDGMRTEPARIAVRTRWLYSDPDPRTVVPEGRTRHAFFRSGHVTASDIPSALEHMQDLASHIHRAVAAFGDDKDLIIEVRLAGDAPTLPDVVDAVINETPGLPIEYRERIRALLAPYQSKENTQ